MLRSRRGTSNLEGLVRRGHEPNDVESERFGRVDQREQMAEVRRIEAAAEDPDTHPSYGTGGVAGAGVGVAGGGPVVEGGAFAGVVATGVPDGATPVQVFSTSASPG